MNQASLYIVSARLMTLYLVTVSWLKPAQNIFTRAFFSSHSPDWQSVSFIVAQTALILILWFCPRLLLLGIKIKEDNKIPTPSSECFLVFTGCVLLAIPLGEIFRVPHDSLWMGIVYSAKVNLKAYFLHSIVASAVIFYRQEILAGIKSIQSLKFEDKHHE